MNQTFVRAPSAMLSLRRAMVDNQIRTFDVTDQLLLDRFYTVPREAFLPPTLGDLPYSDAVLTAVGSGEARRVQLIPMVLARMLQGAKIQPTDRVLVAAGGTGYTAAIVAGLADRVTTLDSDPGFAATAEQCFQALGLSNVKAVNGKLAEGYPAGAPYDLIVVSGATETHLDRLLAQLSPSGRLVTIQKSRFDGVRRAGKAVIHERFGRDFSVRTLFDSSAPVLDEFRELPSFAF